MGFNEMSSSGYVWLKTYIFSYGTQRRKGETARVVPPSWRVPGTIHNFSDDGNSEYANAVVSKQDFQTKEQKNSFRVIVEVPIQRYLIM
jgi:hypothetical protein